jgi:hypothetical protein
MLLPHHFGEIAGAVFAREDKVRHGLDSIGLERPHLRAILLIILKPSWQPT